MRAARSAIAQDVDLELVVVDDGSSPPVRLEFDDARARVVRLERNQGPAAARNAGVAAAAAGWLAFLDSDDTWPAGSLAPRLEAARGAADPASVIWSGGFIDVRGGARGRARIPRASAAASDFAAGCWTCPGSTALLSRAAWERSGGQDAALRRLEDYDWLLRWGLAGGRVDVHPTIAAEITRHGRAAPEMVRAAAEAIRAKHAGLAAPLQTRMRSYLSLEIGAALLHAGAPFSGAAALAQSWVLRPRLQPALERFWRAPD